LYEAEQRISALLDENLRTINQIRENLVSGRLADNTELMRRFGNNISAIIAMYALLQYLLLLLHQQIRTSAMYSRQSRNTDAG
jgi:hypothetical protein